MKLAQGTIKFRKAIPLDAQMLTEMAWRSKKYWGYPDKWMEMWRHDLEISKEFIQQNVVEIAVMDNLILGFYGFCIQNGQGALEHLWVDPNFIGKGVGGLLMKRIDERFGYLGRIEIYSDPHARPFYEKYGFTFLKWYDSTPKGRKLPVMVRSNRKG